MSIDFVMLGMPLDWKISILILVITRATLAWNIDDKIIIFIVIVPFIGTEVKTRRTDEHEQKIEGKDLYTFHIDYRYSSMEEFINSFLTEFYVRKCSID